MALAPSYLFLCIGRLVAATGIAVNQVGAPKLLSSWFEGRKELGLVMGLYTWGYTLGVFSSLSILGKIGELRGWRPAMDLLLILAVLALLALAVLLRAVNRPAAERPKTRAPFHPHKLGLAVSLVAVMYLFYNAGTDSYYTFAPDFLVRRGFPLGRASFLGGTYAWVAFALKPIFASLLNRRTAPYFASVGSATAIDAFLLLMRQTVHPYAVSALVGISIALTMPTLLAWPAFLVPQEKTGQAYGLLQLAYSLAFFAQPLIGFSIDRTRQYGWAFSLMSLYCLLALAAAIVLMRLKSHAVRAPAVPAASSV
jgi:MFS family permease